ncbi:MAG: flagellar M-ring protein FliF [Marinovum sp.]|nr:flagellar M-ring protein FliF [Marinovum sp.]
MSDTSTNAVNVVPQQTGLISTVGSSFRQANNFYRQPGIQRALPSIAAAIVAILGIIIFTTLQTPDRTTLFASLSESEKSRVFDALKNSGMDVQIDPATGELTVPVNDYHTAKLNLAAQGIPMQAAEGYGTLDNMPMGTSRSLENLKIKQSLEYELARSIGEIETISNARVHLAIPERSAFARNSQEPSASVFVELGAGRALNSQQVEAIVNLVSSSVPNLGKNKVSIVDQSGRLLSNAIEDPASTASELQFQYRMRIENIYRSRVERLLTPIVGPGNVSSQVNIEIDFTSIEVTEDRVLPNDTVLLSQQTSRDEEVMGKSGGIPGAISNQPPSASTFETVDQGAAATTDPATSEEANKDKTVGTYAPDNSNTSSQQSQEFSETKLRSSSEVQNFEVSRQISTKKMPSATIQKITVAVLLREQTTVDANGEVQTLKISDVEKTEIQDLVSSALGLTPERGDKVIITTRPFVTKIIDGIETKWYEEVWLKDLANKFLMLLIITVVSLAVIRPLLSRLLTPSQDSLKASFAEASLEDLENMELEEGQSLEDLKAKLKPKKATISAEMLDTANSYDDKVALIRMMVSDEAGRVSNVFKAMMQDDLDVI